MTAVDKCYIEEKVVIITGGGGLLGQMIGEAVFVGMVFAVLLVIWY